MSGLSDLTPGTWNIDPAHSSVSFVARHLMISKVRGSFTSFSGSLTIAEEPLNSSVTATIDAASVTTGDTGRDGHLQSPDFFDVAAYPNWTFQSTGIVVNGDDYVLNGNLTIKSVTKPVSFALEFDGVGTDPWNNTKAGFSAESEINRKDWGLAWNAPLEAGGVLVGEKVKLQLDIQAVKA